MSSSHHWRGLIHVISETSLNDHFSAVSCYTVIKAECFSRFRVGAPPP